MGSESKEWIEEKEREYAKEGWRRAEVVGRLAFVSPNGRWMHCWDYETGMGMFIDAEWIKNLRMRKSDGCKGEADGAV